MPAPATKSGIVWDLDGTLYANPEPMKQAWLEGFYRAALAHHLGLDRAQADRKTRAGFHRYGNAIRAYALDYGVDENAFFETVLTFMDVNMIDPCHHTRDHFSRERHHAMAILTSAHKDWAFPVLRHIGLDHLFPATHVVAYCDTEGHLKSGSEKPFRMAADVLKADPAQLVMVEDTPSNLVIAKDLGMATVLITHGDAINSRPAHVDFVVDKAYDVFTLIHQGQIPWHTTNPAPSPFLQP